MRYRWSMKDGSGFKIEVVRSMDDRDIMPSREELDEEGLVELSPHELCRFPESPLVPQSHRPARNKGFRKITPGELQEMKEVNQLEAASFDLPDSERGEIHKEMAKLSGEDVD